MNQILRVIAHYAIDKYHHCIGYLVPINKNKVFFDSIPDYSDNSRAMSDYLLETSDYEIYWAVKEKPSYKTNPRVHFVLIDNKWEYIYHTLSSKFLFSTHGAFSWANPKRQMFVCFWHGTMLKRVAYMQNPSKNKYYNRTVRFYTSPSEFYNHIFANSFNKTEDAILLSGYPRIDFLLNRNDSFNKLGISRTKYKKILVYLPTFRQPMGGGYVDSCKNVFEDNYINFSDPISLEKWNNFFNKIGVLFIVKPHPSDKYQLSEKGFSNILIIPHSQLLKKDIQLYSILHYADALITDFSSVYCDYMVLDRPIGFMLSDIEEYSKGRGFVFDKPIDMLPGYKIHKEDDFVSFCCEVSAGEDSTKEVRDKLQSLYNKYLDGCFCERIATMINMNINQ